MKPYTQAVQEYLGTYELRGLADSSRVEAEISLRKFGEYIGDPDLAVIDQQRIDDYIRLRIRSDKSKYSCNKHLANLAAFLKWAGLNLKIKKLKTAAPEIRTVRQSEILALIRACPTNIWKARIILSLCTGLRSDDLDNLKTENVNIEEMWVDTHSRKTGKSYGMRPLPDALKGYLSGYLLSVQLLAMKHEGKLLPDKNLRRMWDWICENAGVENVTRHDLRKTFGTMIAAGSYAKEAQSLLEHSSIRTTARHYLSQGEVLRAAVNRLPVEEWVRAAGYTTQGQQTA